MADDDEDDQMLIRGLFRQHCPDYPLDMVQNGQELIDQLEGGGGPVPSLILLDLNMPLLGGFEVLRHLRDSERLRTVPVVVLTTSADERDINQSYALGANAFLTKPGSHAELQAMVLHLRDFWLRQARLPTVAAATDSFA